MALCSGLLRCGGVICFADLCWETETIDNRTEVARPFLPDPALAILRFTHFTQRIARVNIPG
jgi:hypothetical protein